MAARAMGARARGAGRGAAGAAAGGLRPRVVAARAAAEPSTANAANFKLKFLYLEKNIGFAVDQVVGKSQHLSPPRSTSSGPGTTPGRNSRATSSPWITSRRPRK